MNAPLDKEELDQADVRSALGGDLAGFERLVSRYEGLVFGLAMRMLGQRQDAEDVTQQTFLSAMEHLGGFRGEASFSTWLLRIATHAALKVIRKRRGLEWVPLQMGADAVETREAIPHPEYIADWSQSPQQLAEKREVGDLLEKALVQLDEKHRLVFLLRDVQGLSVRETAEALGLSEANTKVRLLRARLQLREHLTRLFGDPARVVRRGHHHHD